MSKLAYAGAIGGYHKRMETANANGNYDEAALCSGIIMRLCNKAKAEGKLNPVEIHSLLFYGIIK